MDMDQPAQIITETVPPPAPVNVQPSPSTPKSRKGPLIIFLVILGLILAGGLVYAGMQIGKKQAQISASPTPIPTEVLIPTITSISTPTPDPTAGWKTYTGNIFSVKYPVAWLAKKDQMKSIDNVEIYDPNSMQNELTNGGATISLPTKYVNILIVASTETPKQYADKVTSGPEYNGVQTNRKTVTINGLTAEMYIESGEGARGYDIAASNGIELAIINIPTVDIEVNLTIKQILSTFNFLP